MSFCCRWHYTAVSCQENSFCQLFRNIFLPRLTSLRKPQGKNLPCQIFCFWYEQNSKKDFIHGKRERRFYGLYSCRAVLNASMESAHTTLSGSWFQWTIVSAKNECLDCSVLQSGTLRNFEFFIKRLSMIFVVSVFIHFGFNVPLRFGCCDDVSSWQCRHQPLNHLKHQDQAFFQRLEL